MVEQTSLRICRFKYAPAQICGLRCNIMRRAAFLLTFETSSIVRQGNIKRCQKKPTSFPGSLSYWGWEGENPGNEMRINGVDNVDQGG